MGLFNKKELERIAVLEQENETLKNRLEQLHGLDYLAVQSEIANANKQIEQINHEKERIREEAACLEREVLQKKKLLGILECDIEMMNFGLYSPKYNCMDSEEYATKIKENREKQKSMIKNKTALNYFDGWTLDGSKKKGQAMNNDNMKMYLRAFNNECDVLISKVKYNNFEAIETKIRRCAFALDKLNSRNKISIKTAFLELKIDELHLVHEYNCKKQEEKEAMRQAREEERELAKLQKEIESKRKEVKKEQQHYLNAKDKLEKMLEKCIPEDRGRLLEQISDIDRELEEINNNLKDIDYREANSRAGYVYVISNIGSFGEGIYKIGMTRRLDPQDRIDELGDASVPFAFDVHAMIFSDDAPALENALHQAFEDRKVNMINGRKEFFRVSLDEIEAVVKSNHEKLIEFKKIADAEQYRETLKILGQ